MKQQQEGNASTQQENEFKTHTEGARRQKKKKTSAEGKGGEENRKLLANLLR
jgi:hypothetical protein